MKKRREKEQANKRRFFLSFFLVNRALFYTLQLHISL